MVLALAAMMGFTSSGGEHAKQRATNESVVDTIPFELDDTRIYVPVSDSTRPIGWFILDTGAQPTIVDVAIAERWQAVATDSSFATGAGGGRTRSSTIRGRTLYVGRVPLRVATINVLPIDSLLGAVSGRTVGGIIGSAFFHQHDVTIDFANQRLYLRPPGSGTGVAGRAVAFELRNDVPYASGTLRLPGGRTLPTTYLLDIGAKSTVLFAEPFLEKHGVNAAISGPSFVAPLGAGVGGATRYRFARVQQITLGSVRDARWSDVVVGLSVGGTLRSSSYDGLFGLDMLLRFIPTFDYKRKMLWLAPRASPPRSSEVDLSGLFIIEERMPRRLRVSALVDASAAAASGIAVGDELVAVDRTSVASLKLGEVREILRSREGREVSVTVTRGGVTSVRVFTLRRMT